MKNIFALIFTLLFFTKQAQNWQWAKTAMGDGDGTCMAADVNGNLYVSGETGGMVVDNYTLGPTIYYIKYDPAGNIAWAKSSNIWNGVSTGASADVYGNSYFTGSFSDTLIIDTYTLASPVTTMFLIKFDAAGNVVWAKAPAVGENYAYSVSNDGNGNCYAAGFYDSTCVFGNYTLTVNPGASHAFLAKFDSYGNVIWATGSGSTSQDIAVSVVSDISGNTYMTGKFSSPLFSIGNYTLVNSGSADFFIAKYDPNGSAIWAKSGSGSSDDIGTSVCLGQNGRVYVAGTFLSPVFTVGNNTLNCPGGNKFFIAQYDVNGNTGWAKANSGGDAMACSVSSYMNSVFLTGQMNGSITLGIGTINLPPASLDPAYLLEVDATGNFISGYSFKSGGDDFIGVSTDNQCNVFWSGDFATGNFILGNDTLTLTSGESLFVAKLSYSCQGLPDQLEEKNVSSSPVKIYPNPSVGEFTIEPGEKNSFITIYNLLGEKVFEKRVEASSELLKTAIPIGIYICRIESAGKIKEEKLLIN